MISPFEGRVTANHHTRGGYTGHRGFDIAPPKPGQTGLPVYAAFAGTVRELHRTAKPGNKNSTWAPYRTGNGGLIANPDGEGNGYNHMTPLASLKVGDKVAAGELIGHNDRSGTQSGPHLHFEMWKDWRNAFSDYDPRLAFDAHKVTPGSKPDVDVKPAGTIKPRPPAKPAAKPKPKPVKKYRTLVKGSRGADVLALSRALRAKGYNQQGDTRTFTEQLRINVKDWQRIKDLRQDAKAGPITQQSLGL